MKDILCLIKKIPTEIIKSLENEEISLSNYWITFIFILALRFFLESYSTTTNYFNIDSKSFFFDMIHYNLAYIALALLIIYIFHFATKTSINMTTRVVLPSFLLVMIAPSLDLLLTQGRGTDMHYFVPWEKTNIILAYLTYCNYGGFHGASTGIKYEVIIVLFGCYTYFRVKQCKWLSSIFFTWCCYSCIFLWSSTPYFIKWFLEITKFDMEFSSHFDSVMMTDFYLFILLFLGSFIFYLSNKQLFISFIFNIYFSHLLLYEFLFLLGVTLAYKKATMMLTTQLFIQPNILLNTLFSMISILFSVVFFTAMNKISQYKKNLEYKIVGFISLIIAFLYAAMVGTKMLLIIYMINASHYITTMPPLYLNRHFIFSKCMSMLNSIALIVSGYIVVLGQVYLIPHYLYWVIAGGHVFFSGLLFLLNKKIRVC